MTSGELLDLFRVEMNDRTEPKLWSDEFIFGAIDDAQKQFTRLTDGIPDSTTPAVVELAVTTAGDTYALHPAILKIRSARRLDNGRPVAVVNEEDMPTRNMFFDGITGTLQALVTGMDENSVRVWPMPREAADVRLSVFRLPLVDITDDQAFEIGVQHHRHLLMWAKHLAYGVQDAETFDKTKSQEFKDRFEVYCFKAKQEQARARHKPRAVAYGGI